MKFYLLNDLFPEQFVTISTKCSSGFQAFQTTGQKQYIGKFVRPLRKILQKAIETRFYAY